MSVDLLQQLYTTGQLGGGQSAHGQQKPIQIAAAAALAIGGVNLADTDHFGHASPQGLTGKDWMQVKMLSLSSKENPGSFTQKIAAEMGNKYFESFKNGSQASGSSGGGSSGGSYEGSTSTASASSSSGSSAPVSSGGGGGGGGGSSSSAPQSRGGSSDAGLASAIAAARGISFDPQVVSPVQHIEISAPIAAAAPTPPAPVAAIENDGVGGIG